MQVTSRVRPVPPRARAAAAGLLLLAAGCGRSELPPPVEEPVAESAQATAPAEPTASDAQILHIAITVNTIDAQFGAMALTLSEDPDVARFAEVMIADHRAINEEFRRLAARLNVTPLEHELSRQFEQAVAAARPAIDTLASPAFDRAYMQREVEFHQAVLQAWDRTLVPSARDAQVKALLENARPMVEGHLLRARQIRAARGG